MEVSPKVDERLSAGFRRAAAALAWVVGGLGALVFVGWAVDRPALAPRLSQLVRGEFIRQLSTGLAFVLLGAALRARVAGGRWSRAATACALGAAAVGGFILVENATGWEPLVALGQTRARRMEPETALDVVVIGGALALLGARGERVIRLAQALAGVALLIALAALFGHAYSVKMFFGVTAYTKMSLGAIAGFSALAFGLWFARPDAGLMTVVSSDGAAGFAARRLYPAVIGSPLLLGVLTLAGEEARLYNGKFGLSVLVLACIVVLLLLAVLVNGALDKSDRARLRLSAVLLEESERRHLARELHDEIGQSLTALKVRLEMGALDEARALVAELMARVSSLSLDLRPAMLDDLGLLPALLWLFDRYRAQTGVAVEFVHEGLEPRAPHESETAAFRIVQEALNNVAKHAGAARVTVRVFRRDDALTVQVEDGGRGFDPEAALAGASTSGLIGMRERASALGGTLTISAARGRGTRLDAQIPARRVARS